MHPLSRAFFNISNILYHGQDSDTTSAILDVGSTLKHACSVMTFESSLEISLSIQSFLHLVGTAMLALH